jgi:hypothetical protein
MTTNNNNANNAVESLVLSGGKLEGLQRGASYKRKALHDRFGGQRQGGIATPLSVPIIFLFTKGWDSLMSDNAWIGGTLYFPGEGRKGDMEWKAGNKALREHKEKGKRVYLFIARDKASGYVTYSGEVEYTGFEYRQTKDMNGDPRQSIIFHLKPIGWTHPDTPPASWMTNRTGAGAPSTTTFNSQQGSMSSSTSSSSTSPPISKKRKEVSLTSSGGGIAGGSSATSGGGSPEAALSPKENDKNKKKIKVQLPLPPPDEKQIQALVNELARTDRRAEEMDFCVYKILTALSGNATGKKYIAQY